MHLFRPFLAIAITCVSLSWAASQADAALFRARAQAEELVAPSGPLLGSPVIGPAVGYRHSVASPVAVASYPAPSGCCPVPCIRYKDHVHRRSCFACEPKINVILQASSQCGCCVVEIPVCIPACCQGVPCVKERGGLFGREIVHYEWKCGFRMKIVFDRHGDATVHYLG
jgi:hypothetical protein